MFQLTAAHVPHVKHAVAGWYPSAHQASEIRVAAIAVGIFAVLMIVRTIARGVSRSE